MLLMLALQWMDKKEGFDFAEFYSENMMKNGNISEDLMPPILPWELGLIPFSPALIREELIFINP